MGLGGMLIYSALVSNVKQSFPNKKILLIYPKNYRDFMFSHKTDAEIIFSNNNNIYRLINNKIWLLLKLFYKKNDYYIIDISNPKYHHHLPTKEKNRLNYKQGKNAIEWALEAEGIFDGEIKPNLILTEDETSHAQSVLKQFNLVGKKIICFEAGGKVEFTPNKVWFHDRWKELINKLNLDPKILSEEIELVQIGAPSTPPIEGAIYLNGKLSFRETGEILRNSLVLISCIGGLTHLARAFNCRNISLKSAWEPRELTHYKGDLEAYTEIECKNCGLLTPCEIGRKCMSDISVEDVLRLVKETLTTSKDV